MLFHVQKLPTDSSTTLEHIRERGTTIVADNFDAAAERWCEQNRDDVDRLYNFELAIADSNGKHRMFTVTPTVALTFRPSKYQGLE